jgi:drug/metabolite transporter (DMT)-like permease
VLELGADAGVLGGFLALLSAATFALNNASVRRGVLTGSVLQAMAVTVPIGVPLFFIPAVAIGYFGAVPDFSFAAVIALSVAGILHFVWGRYCNYRSMRAIGTNLAAPVQQVNLIVTLVAAIWILGETLTPLRILGISLVLLGPSFTLREGPAPKAASVGPAAVDAEKVASVENVEASAGGIRAGVAFEPRYAEGYMFALLSATGYGLSPILIRLALEQQGLGASITGGLISYTAATAIMAIVLIWPGQLRHALAVTPESVKWFTLSGIMVCISQMFLFMALAVAPVTVVAPISRLTIVLRIYFSRLLTPEHEVFGGRVILGTLVSLGGAVLLSLSAEVVSSVLPLPEAVAAVLKWQWP